MDKSYFVLVVLLLACHPQQTKNNNKPPLKLVIETLCESENGIFHYYRTYKSSTLSPETEFIDHKNDGTLDYVRSNNSWSRLHTNKTPEHIKNNRTTLFINCKETMDPLGDPMKKYWENSFYSTDKF